MSSPIPPRMSGKEARSLEGGCSVNVGALLMGDVMSWGDCRAVSVMLEEELGRCSTIGLVAMVVEELLRLIPDERLEDWRLVCIGASLVSDVCTSPPPPEGGSGRTAA